MTPSPRVSAEEGPRGPWESVTLGAGEGRTRTPTPPLQRVLLAAKDAGPGRSSVPVPERSVLSPRRTSPRVPASTPRVGARVWERRGGRVGSPAGVQSGTRGPRRTPATRSFPSTETPSPAGFPWRVPESGRAAELCLCYSVFPAFAQWWSRRPWRGAKAQERSSRPPET